MLKADTVLIGLHCSRTTVSAIVSPKEGCAVCQRIGVWPLAGSPNILWQSGEKSVMDDIAFSARRRGPRRARGRRSTGWSVARGGAAGAGGGGAGAAAPRWRSGCCSRGCARRGGGETPPYLVVDNGGGGVIRNMWVEGGGRVSGLRAEDTSTPMKIYQLSNEHHTRVEVILHNVQNWEFHCLQTEEEAGQQSTYALEIQNCKNILFANGYHYRVSRTAQPVPFGAKIKDSDGIVFDNIHVFSQARLPFDNTVLEEGSGVTVRANNFTHLVVSTAMKKGAAAAVAGGV